MFTITVFISTVYRIAVLYDKTSFIFLFIVCMVGLNSKNKFLLYIIFKSKKQVFFTFCPLLMMLLLICYHLDKIIIMELSNSDAYNFSFSEKL